MDLVPDIVDGEYLLPYDDDYMKYDSYTKKYTLTTSALYKYLNLKLGMGESENNAFIAEQRDAVYRALLQSMHNPTHTEIVRFRIARTVAGREAIFNAMLSQVRYAFRHFQFMYEGDEGISPNAIEDLRQAGLWHKGRYNYYIEEDYIGVGY